jgi:hypothetical protein
VRADEGATSRRLGPNQQNRGGARRSLVYSTKSSQTQNSQELIAELRQEIQTLKQEVRDEKLRAKFQAKERQRKRHMPRNAEAQEHPGLSRNSRHEDFSETSSSQSESRSPTPPTIPRKLLNPGELHGLVLLFMVRRVPQRRSINQEELFVQEDRTLFGRLSI